MTKRQGKSGTIDVKALLAEDEEFLRALVRTALQEVLEAEMTEALGAEKGERAAGRQGYRSDSGVVAPGLVGLPEREPALGSSPRGGSVRTPAAAALPSGHRRAVFRFHTLMRFPADITAGRARR